MGRTFRNAAMICLLAFGLVTIEADAKPGARVPVAAMRVGLMTSRTPRMGPQLVLRGGYTPITEMVRPRFAGGMVDIYPEARSGFRFSIGNKYYNRANYWATAEQATGGLLYEPHMTRGGIGLQRAFRRYTPAMTVGYDIEMAPNLVVGIEGGALKGRAINPGPRGQRFRNDDRKVGASGVNPIAALTLRYAL